MSTRLVDFKYPFNETLHNNTSEIKDLRNGIICNRTKDISDKELIMNYYDYLKTHTAEYKRYDYLNLGMTCVTYFPSFIEGYREDVIRCLKQLGVEYYVVPSFSLLQNKSFDIHTDVICFKDNLANALGKGEWNVSATDLLELVFNEQEGQNEFNKI